MHPNVSIFDVCDEGVHPYEHCRKLFRELSPTADSNTNADQPSHCHTKGFGVKVTIAIKISAGNSVKVTHADQPSHCHTKGFNLKVADGFEVSASNSVTVADADQASHCHTNGFSLKVANVVACRYPTAFADGHSFTIAKCYAVSVTISILFAK
jgi:hypothetical protein